MGYAVELTEEDRELFALLVTEYAERVGTLMQKSTGETQDRCVTQLKWALRWIERLERLTARAE